MQSSPDTGAVPANLQGAVDYLSRCSLELTQTYRLLEQQIQQLNAELSAVREARQQEQAKHRRLASRLDGLMHLLPAGVVLTDHCGRVTDANPFAQNCLESSLTGDDLLQSLRAASVSGATSANGEVTFANGRRIRVQRCELGQGEEALHLLVDMTEQHRLQTELDQYQRLSALGEMTARLAHQLRTPLTAARLSLDCLELADADGRARGVQRMETRLSELSDLVDDLLLFAAQREMDAHALDLGQLLEDLHQRAGERWGDALRLSVLCTEQVEIDGNRCLMLSALENLVDNAVKAAGGSQVRIEVDAHADSTGGIEIFITDNGPGIDSDLSDIIFEPFWSGSINGTGLGLCVTREVIQAHNGSIACVAHEQGARFRITLPVRNQWLVAKEACA